MGLKSALKAGQTVVELGQDARNLKQPASDFHSADKGDMGRKAGHQAFNTGTDTGKEMGKTWLKTFETIPRFVCRGLQLVFAIIACGFYGNRLDADRRAGNGPEPEWIFAVLIAGVSALSAIFFVAVVPLGAMPFLGSRLKMVKTYRFFTWDFSMFILWIVVFGIFAGIFLKRESDDPYKGASTTAMKTAVWVDFANCIFWLISGVYGLVKTCLGRRADKLTDKVGNKLFTKKNKEAGMEMDAGQV